MPSTGESHVEQLKQIDVFPSQQKAVVAILEDQKTERSKRKYDEVSIVYFAIQKFRSPFHKETCTCKRPIRWSFA
ncbi:hypothetical protein FF011L_07100 [Roseimaritima multifibrata]|uniref:Uncharacterized protein n=1 Tax=Roseimaritima multifibrata TaxID=1930274 RepID=A0A517MAR8_9BACT|nr:hypothetical protein FF011L_07100 [Roseimaritima multifibrata]